MENLVGRKLKGQGKQTWSIEAREVKAEYVASRGMPPAECYLLVPSASFLTPHWMTVEKVEKDIQLGLTRFAK